MDNTGDINFGFYDLIYRNAVINKNRYIKFEINVTDDTNKKVLDTLKELKSIKSQEKNEIRFSDVIYDIFPKIDNKTGVIKYNYVPIFSDNRLNGDTGEYVDRYKNFDINKLPFIDVAKLLNIEIEKSNQIKVYGMYRPYENKIILGTDYIPTFIHELAHALDFHLSDHLYEKNYSELAAELSTIVICKIYSIPIILSYSLNYLDAYSSSDINAKQLIHRVSEIVECIKKFKEHLKSK